MDDMLLSVSWRQRHTETPAAGHREANSVIAITELGKEASKPMGVATYRTREDMPEKMRKALPDIEELKKLL